MPDLEPRGASGAGQDGATRGRAPSRRTMLCAAAGAGAAGLAASALAQIAVAVPAQASSRSDDRTSARRTTSSDALPAEPVVVHVRDAATGELDVFRGSQVTRVHDRALAARIVGASK